MVAESAGDVPYKSNNQTMKQNFTIFTGVFVFLLSFN